MSNYEALKAFGFSAAKSLEISLDAKRKVKHALAVVSIARAALSKSEGK